MLFLYFVLSITAGITIVLARIVNARLAEKIGTIQSTVINYITGLSLSILIYLISKEGSLLKKDFQGIPIWAYFGGLAGVIIIMASNYMTPRISAFYITLLIFIGQLFLGIVIDYFMLHELSPGKVIGGILVAAGLTYNLFIDKKNNTVADSH